MSVVSSSVVGDEVSTVAVGVRCSLSHAHTHNTVLAVSVWLFGLVGVVVLLFLRWLGSFVPAVSYVGVLLCCCSVSVVQSVRCPQWSVCVRSLVCAIGVRCRGLGSGHAKQKRRPTQQPNVVEVVGVVLSVRA